MIADDHPVVVMGLDSLFATEKQYRVVARCVNGQEALEAVAAHDPDILLLDMKMPKLDGMGVLRALRSGDYRTRPIVLSAMLDEGEVRTALRLGARGVILKENAAQQLIQCIRTVHEGGYWIEQAGLARVLRTTPPDAKKAVVLTERELEIASLVGDGLRNKEIAQKLRITEGTVKVHLNNIYRKLGVDSRVGLALHTHRRGV